MQSCRKGGGFRLWLGGGVALRLRSAWRSSPLAAPLFPLADRRPKATFIAAAGVRADATPLDAPTIPLCGRSPRPGQIL